jgi:hypothetical protein
MEVTLVSGVILDTEKSFEEQTPRLKNFIWDQIGVMEPVVTPDAYGRYALQTWDVTAYSLIVKNTAVFVGTDPGSDPISQTITVEYYG